MTALLPGMPPAYGAPVAYGPPVYVSSLSQVPAGAIPVSQEMLARALGQPGMGAQLVQVPSVIGSVLKGAAIGGLAGAAFGAIPFLPLGLVSGGLVGAGVGAMIGLAKGLSARRTMGQMQTLAQAQSLPMTAAGTPEPVPAKQKVVMNAEQRKRFAARIRAEKAAAQKAAK